MTKVVPAILASSVDDYRVKLRLTRQLTDRYQLDVIDPAFADNKTFDLSQIEPRVDMICDIHLMAVRPLDFLPDILALRPHLIIVQFEQALNLDKVLDKIAAQEIKVGLAINPATEVEQINKYLPLLQHVLVMGVDAGYSGQKLQPKVLKKVEQLRRITSTVEVGLDGGVSADSLLVIAKSNFDVVNVNSYLFGSADPLERYSELIEAFA